MSFRGCKSDTCMFLVNNKGEAYIYELSGKLTPYTQVPQTAYTTYTSLIKVGWKPLTPQQLSAFMHTHRQKENPKLYVPIAIIIGGIFYIWKQRMFIRRTSI